MTVACHLAGDDDSPMTVTQMFTYIRHRYGDLRAYYLEGREVIAVPLSGEPGEAIAELRELAARKGLACSEVCAAWPELVGPGLAGIEDARSFLVISPITDKYLRPG